MGGSNETIINGLRFHVSNGCVHIHDDSKKLKFEMNTRDFKNEIKDAYKQLENEDGLIEISSSIYSNDSFFVMKNAGEYSIFLTKFDTSKTTLDNFLKGI